ncbi:MAG: helix-turn-helix domain-containing protein [Chloroflexota bacterium]
MLSSSQSKVSLVHLLESAWFNQVEILVGEEKIRERVIESFRLLVGEAEFSEEPDILPYQLVVIDVDHVKFDLLSLMEKGTKPPSVVFLVRSAQILDQWISYAKDNGLVLLQLPEAIHPISLVNPLMEILLSKDHSLLLRTSSIQQQMANQLLRNQDIPGILTAFYTLIKSPVLFIDEEYQLIAHNGPWQRKSAWDTIRSPNKLEEILAPILKNVSRYVIEGNPIEVDIQSQRLSLLPVMMTKQVGGCYMIDLAGKGLDTAKQVVIEQALLATALALNKQFALRQAEQKLKASLIDDLLRGRFHHGTAKEQANKLGWNLDHKRNVLIVTSEKALEAKLLRILHNYIDKQVKLWRDQSLVFQRGDEILIFPHLPEAAQPISAREIIRDMCHALLAQRPKQLQELNLVLAIGSVQPNFEALNSSFFEARRALAVRKLMQIKQEIISFDEIRLYSVLERILDDDEVKGLFEHTLRPLANYDKAQGSELVYTMEVYFDCNLRLQQAAERLFIHPNSLKYRLQRIRDILQLDPFSDRDHIQYYLATKLLRLL